jgi:hypothetical protein
MMGSDVDHDDDRAIVEAAHQRRADVMEAAEIRMALCIARGLTPSQACQVGCATCGVIDASPAHCEQCTGAHSAATNVELTGRHEPNCPAA